MRQLLLTSLLAANTFTVAQAAGINPASAHFEAQETAISQVSTLGFYGVEVDSISSSRLAAEEGKYGKYQVNLSGPHGDESYDCQVVVEILWVYFAMQTRPVLEQVVNDYQIVSQIVSSNCEVL